MASDGSVDKNRKRIQIGLATIDKEHLVKFKKCINGTQEIKDSERIIDKNKPFYSKFKKDICYYSCIRVNSQQMVKDLERFGVMPQKTYSYMVPDEIINHPLFCHFVRGAIDGDGSISYKEKEIGVHYIMLWGRKIYVEKVIDFIFNKLKLKSRGYKKN